MRIPGKYFLEKDVNFLFEEPVLSKKTGEDFRRYVRKGSDTASCLMLSLPTFEVSERV